MDPVVFGRVDDVDELDLDPVELTLVGYNLDREEVTHTFRVRPLIPAGAQLEIVRHTLPNGNVPLAQVVDFLDECVLAEDLDAYKAFLHRPDVMVEQDALIQMYQWLGSYYAARPTRRRPDSASGGSATRRTSRDAARSAASARKRSRST